jgi:hypothetical protein
MDFATASRRHNLPVKLTRLIGRHEIIDNLAQQLSMRHLLTIVGSGGIGQTAVALDVGRGNLIFLCAQGMVDRSCVDCRTSPGSNQHRLPR